jgi:hypothetical protein
MGNVGEESGKFFSSNPISPEKKGEEQEERLIPRQCSQLYSST